MNGGELIVMQLGVSFSKSDGPPCRYGYEYEKYGCKNSFRDV